MSEGLTEALEWIAIVVLGGFSGLFSGLNLGLMSLDINDLEIVMASDNESHVKAAKKIKPLRMNGNWLLCTLLLGNVAVNAALSILLADKTDGLIGFFLSTGIIVIFGEIIPQALCSRYALEIGSKTVYIVWPLMILMSPLAWPISYILDKALGDELGTIYSNKELTKLVDIHAKFNSKEMDENTASMLKGALQLNEKKVNSIMTRMNDVFWLNENEKLSFDILSKIFKLGHSRIPIFRTNNDSSILCVGLLYVKDLILIDPDDQIPIIKVLQTFDHHNKPIDVWKEDTLQTTLQLFINSSQHLAFVKAKNQINDKLTEYVGIITLEDVIEEILKRELIDEYDIDGSNDIDWEKTLFHQQRKHTKNKKTKKKPKQDKDVMMRPVPVRLNQSDGPKKSLLLTPHIMNQPFMPKHTASFSKLTMDDEEDDIDESKDGDIGNINNKEKDIYESLKSNQTNVTTDEMKYQDDDNNNDNMNNNSPNFKKNEYIQPQSIKSTARIRTIPEIKSYLEHFIPKLSFTTSISCLFIKPFLISANIYFIVYQFYVAIFADELQSSLNFQGSRVRKYGTNVIITIEFIGLMLLFITAIMSYFKANYAVSIDSIRWCGSWSIFQLFYTFQPLILLKYLSTTLTNYYNTQIMSNSDRIKKWKYLRDNLQFEITQQLNNNKNNKNNRNIQHMNECLNHLNFLIDLHETSKNNFNFTKIEQDLQELHGQIDKGSFGNTDSFNISPNMFDNSFGASFNRYRASTYNYDKPNDLKNEIHEFNVINSMIHAGSWLIFICILIILLCFGAICLLLKLSLFAFIINLPITEWDFYYHWVPFILFINQIWNIIDIDSIKLSTIYQFLFIDSSIKYSRYVNQRISMLDNIIKEQLWVSFGNRGFLVALSLNDEIVHKIIVNKSYDLTVIEMIKYREIIQKRDEFKSNQQNDKIENKSNKIIDFFQDKANWVKMVNVQQIYHPYAIIRENMDTYYNNLDSMNSKILITVFYKEKLNYHEYKLAVKAFTAKQSNLSEAICDDGSIISLYNDNTLSQKRQSMRKLIQYKNKKKRNNNKLLLEMQSKQKSPITPNEISRLSTKRTYHNVKENKLLEGMVLFQLILKYCSKLTRIITLVLIVISLLATFMSVLLYLPERYNDCTDQDLSYIESLSIFDVVFLISSLILLFSTAIYIKFKLNQKCSKYIGYLLFCIMWLVIIIIALIKFIYFWLLSFNCKWFIIDTKTFVFISVLGSGYLVAFMLVVLLLLFLNWISEFSSPNTDCSRITWLTLMVFMLILHLFLLIIFYIFGWNFCVDCVVQTIQSTNYDIFQGNDYSDYCTVRYIVHALLFFMLIFYLIIGLLEFYFLIKTDLENHDDQNFITKYELISISSAKKLDRSTPNKNEPTQKLLKDDNNKKTKFRFYGSDDMNGHHSDNNSDDDNDQSLMLKFNEKNYLRFRKFRKFIVGSFYLTSILHAIIDDIINEISDECEEQDYLISEDAIFYNKNGKNFFVFIALIDLILFGQLFSGYKILLDPWFWFGKLIWRTTKIVILSIISLLFTSLIFIVLAILFVQYDLELL